MGYTVRVSSARTPKDVFVAYRKAYLAKDQRTAKPLLARILKENLAFVRMMGRRFEAQWGLPIPKGDLEQAGIAGMIRSLQSYDPEKSRFSTWSGDWIRFYHQELARLEGHRIKKHVPSAVMRALTDLRASLGREPTAEEVEALAGVPVPLALFTKAIAPPVQFVPLDDVPAAEMDPDTALGLARGLAKLDKRTRHIFQKFCDEPDTKALAKQLGVLEIQVLDAVDKARKVLKMELA